MGNLVAGVLGNEGNTLLDVLLEVTQASLDELLLNGVNGANGMDLLDTIGAELDLAAEEVNTLVLVERGLDEGGLDDTLLALSGAEEGVSHAGTGHGHGEGGRASTVLGLDDLVTTELHTLDELSVGGELGVGALGEERDDGDTGVATNDGDVLVLGVGILELGDEAAGADNVEGGDTEELLGVVDTGLLEDLGADGDGRVDGVGDDEEVSVGGVLGSGLGEIADDGGVGVEEIVTGHAGLAGDTSGDEDNLGVLQGTGEALGGSVIALDGGLGVDVGDIGTDTGGATDVVEGQLSDAGVELEEEGEGLADTAGGTEDGDLGKVARRSGESASLDLGGGEHPGGCLCGVEVELEDGSIGKREEAEDKK